MWEIREEGYSRGVCANNRDVLQPITGLKTKEQILASVVELGLIFTKEDITVATADKYSVQSKLLRYYDGQHEPHFFSFHYINSFVSFFH